MARAAKDPKTGLTPKQEEFVRQVVILGKQGMAYRKAYDAKGMSQNAVDREASLLMDNPKIAQRVAELRERSLRQFDMDVREIALGLSRIARADLREAFDPVTGALLRPEEMPEDLAMAMTSIEVVEMAGGMSVNAAGGDVKHVPMYTKKLRIADRKGALDTLAKWRGMLVDKKEVGKPGEFDQDKAVVRARIRERGVKLGLVKASRKAA